MMLSRRRLVTGLVSLVAAPAIVRVASIMPVKALPPEFVRGVNLAGMDFGAGDVTVISAHSYTKAGDIIDHTWDIMNETIQTEEHWQEIVRAMIKGIREVEDGPRYSSGIWP